MISKCFRLYWEALCIFLLFRSLNLLDYEVIESSIYWGNPVLIYGFLLLGAVPMIVNKLRE